MTIIGSAATQAEVRTAIKRHHSEIPSHRPKNDDYWVRNKAQKLAVKRLAGILRRLKADLNSDDLIFAISRDFPVDEAEFEKWCTLLDKIAQTELPNAGSMDYFKRHAVQAAADFLREHDVPLTIARSGKFCRLAEVF